MAVVDLGKIKNSVTHQLNLMSKPIDGGELRNRITHRNPVLYPSKQSIATIPIPCDDIYFRPTME